MRNQLSNYNKFVHFLYFTGFSDIFHENCTICARCEVHTVAIAGVFTNIPTKAYTFIVFHWFFAFVSSSSTLLAFLWFCDRNSDFVEIEIGMNLNSRVENKLLLERISLTMHLNLIANMNIKTKPNEHKNITTRNRSIYWIETGVRVDILLNWCVCYCHFLKNSSLSTTIEMIA